MRRRCWRCLGDRRDGRPVWGLDFKAFFPPCSSASFHRLTDDGAAPIVRATSRMPRPLANKLAANRRLVSSFAALPFGLMNPLLGFLPATLEDKGASSVKNQMKDSWEKMMKSADVMIEQFSQVKAWGKSPSVWHLRSGAETVYRKEAGIPISRLFARQAPASVISWSTFGEPSCWRSLPFVASVSKTTRSPR